ncbi:unnamed protein product [Ascophyllum nodosum]
MFYSQIILAKKGPLGKIWIAAHWDKKLNKAQIFQTNINTSVVNILEPTVPLALRVSGHLLLGLVRIYSRKVKYLMSDASEALVKIQMAFRPGATDLPAGATEVASGAINDEQRFGNFYDDRMDGDLIIDAFDSSYDVDKWMAEAPADTRRRADISLSDPADDTSMVSATAFASDRDRSGSFMLEGGDLSWGNLTDSATGGDRSRVSDIEAVRDADHSGLRSGRLSVSIDVMSGEKEAGQMEGYDDLGPPTHPNELALDAEIGGGRELDDGGDMDLMDLGGPVDMGGPDLDAPELNTDLEDLGQASLSFRCDGEAAMPGAVQLDDDALNLEGVEFSRTEDGEADGDDDGGFRRDFGGGGEAAPVEEADQPEEEEAAEEVCKPRLPRTRKRRLVLNQVTVIDMATMKASQEDCSDIMRKRRRGFRRVEEAISSLEEHLAGPLMPWLAPKLQELLRSCMAPGGLPFPVRMRLLEPDNTRHGAEDVGARVHGGEGNDEMLAPDHGRDEGKTGDGEMPEDIELTRRGDDSRQSMGVGAGANDTSLSSGFKEQPGTGPDKRRSREDIEGGDLNNFELGGGDDLEMEMNMDGADGGVDFAGEGDELNLYNLPQDRQDEGDDGLDLGGGVNDLEEGEEDAQGLEDRAADGEQAFATADERDMNGDGLEGPSDSGALPRHKWHPHTVKVLRLVQKQLKPASSGRGPAVTHATLTRGATRRTAAGAFFELLQLKTWDFVELSQKEAFGDIRVTAGVSERSSLEISCTLRDSLAVWSMWCLKKNVNASSRPSEHRRVRGKNVKTLFFGRFFFFFLLLYV